MQVKAIANIGLLFLISTGCFALPKGFIHLKYVDPTIIQEIRYYSKNNFMGKRIDGYEAPTCILTREAAFALVRIQQELNRHDLGLKVFDCYRPQTAVDQFQAWSKDPEQQEMKKYFYPNVDKADLFKLNYVAAKSGHTRGSTVDLTVVKYKKGKAIELDMGTPWDFLDPASHPSSDAVSQIAQHNRKQLQYIMEQEGFAPLSTEWWHFSLVSEVNTDTYYDFPVT